jgi:hypothetical protein
VGNLSAGALTREIDRNIKLSCQHGFHSDWSIFPTENFDTVPFPDLSSIVYKCHWGKGPVTMEVTCSPTWLTLWEVADNLIIASGDRHHTFIEKFVVTKVPGTYELITGS